MSDKMTERIIIVLFVILGISFLTFVPMLIYDNGYKRGQIDYANNVIYYELQEQDDNTIEWVYCQEGCLVNE